MARTDQDKQSVEHPQPWICRTEKSHLVQRDYLHQEEFQKLCLLKDFVLCASRIRWIRDTNLSKPSHLSMGWNSSQLTRCKHTWVPLKSKCTAEENLVSQDEACLPRHLPWSGCFLTGQNSTLHFLHEMSFCVSNTVGSASWLCS